MAISAPIATIIIPTGFAVIATFSAHCAAVHIPCTIAHAFMTVFIANTATLNATIAPTMPDITGAIQPQLFTKKLYTSAAFCTTPARAFTISGSPVSFIQLSAGLQNSNALNNASFTPPAIVIMPENFSLFCITAVFMLSNADTP